MTEDEGDDAQETPEEEVQTGNNATLPALLAGCSQACMLHFCLTSTSLVLQRFGIPLERSSAFIGDTLACISFWNLLGFTLALSLSFCGWDSGVYIVPVLYALTTFAAAAYFWIAAICTRVKLLIIIIFVITVLIGIAVVNTSEDRHYLPMILSAIASLVKFVMVSTVAVTIFIGNGHNGLRKYRSWLCLTALFSGFDNSLTLKIAGTDSYNVILGMELSGLLAPFIHWMVSLFGRCICAGRINGYILILHLGTTVVLSVTGTASWIKYLFSIKDLYEHSIKGSKNPSDVFYRSVSPCFMGIIGMGMIFWVFPAIFPFMICHPSKFQFVMLFSTIVGLLATSIPWTLCDTSIIGEGDFMLYTKFNNWKGRNYNSMWFVSFPLILLLWITACCVHYPDCFAARRVLHCWPAFVSGLAFLFLGQLLKSVGVMGAFANAIGPEFYTADITCLLSGTVEIYSGSLILNDFKIQRSGLQLNFEQYYVYVSSGSEPQIIGTPILTLSGIAGEVVKNVEISNDTVNFPTGTVSIYKEKQNTIKITSLELTVSKTNKTISKAKEIDVLTGIQIKQLEVKQNGSGSFKIDNVQVQSATLDLDIKLRKPIEKSKIGQFTFATATLEGTATLCGSDKKLTGTFSADKNSGTVFVLDDGKVKIEKLAIDGPNGIFITFNTGGSLGGDDICLDSTKKPSFILTGNKNPTGTFPHTVKTGQIEGKELGNIVMKSEIKEDYGILQNSADIKLFDQDAGNDKAGQFKSSTRNDTLTSVTLEGLKLDITRGKYFTIDGFEERGNVTGIEVQNKVEIKGGENGFSLDDVELRGAYDIVCNPYDLAHGVTIGNCCMNLSLLHMTVMCFTSHAYSVGIESFKTAKKSDMDWPTYGYGGFRSFCWWVGYGVKNGNRRFWSLGTVDITAVI